MKDRNRIYFIYNNVFDDLFSASEINEELEGIVVMHLHKLIVSLLKSKLIANRIYNTILPETAKFFTRTSNPI
jgi:hypothetical protein